jgi:hypothetical protein
MAQNTIDFLTRQLKDQYEAVNRTSGYSYRYPDRLEELFKTQAEALAKAGVNSIYDVEVRTVEKDTPINVIKRGIYDTNDNFTGKFEYFKQVGYEGSGESETPVYEQLNPYELANLKEVDQGDQGYSITTTKKVPIKVLYNTKTGEALKTGFREESELRKFQGLDIWGGANLGKGLDLFGIQVAEDGSPIFVPVWQETSDKKAIMSALAVLGAAYFGPQMAAASSSTAPALGTGLTQGAAGTTGLTAGAGGVTGLTVPAGFTLAPELGAALAAGTSLSQLPSTDLLSGVNFPQQGIQVPAINSAEISLLPSGTVLPGEGLIAPSLPGINAMGGAQGLSVGVPGGTITQAGLTPAGSVPVLGDAKSFINNPDVLGQPVIGVEQPGISLQDAARAANAVKSLLDQPEQQGVPMDQGGGMQARGVDYSELLSLLQRQVGLPNVGGLLAPVRIRYPNSLLG